MNKQSLDQHIEKSVQSADLKIKEIQAQIDALSPNQRKKLLPNDVDLDTIWNGNFGDSHRYNIYTSFKSADDLLHAYKVNFLPKVIEHEYMLKTFGDLLDQDSQKELVIDLKYSPSISIKEIETSFKNAIKIIQLKAKMSKLQNASEAAKNQFSDDKKNEIKTNRILSELDSLLS